MADTEPAAVKEFIADVHWRYEDFLEEIMAAAHELSDDDAEAVLEYAQTHSGMEEYMAAVEGAVIEVLEDRVMAKLRADRKTKRKDGTNDDR